MNKMAKKDKTNVMRILDQQRLDYDAYQFEGDTPSIPDAPIYKTLVTVGKSKEHYVFVIHSIVSWISRKQPKSWVRRVSI